MADSLSMALTELLRKAEAEPDLDRLREGVRVLTQALMELEVAQHLGAERYQRSPERQGERNGYRERTWDTRVGTLELRVPRVRDGSYFPSLLEPRKRAERALVATVREAYVQGVSTRRVDELVKALGLDGISKSQVSQLCQELDAEVERFRSRRLEGTYPYLWVDATFLKVREGGRVLSMAEVPYPFHEECPGVGPQGRPADGRRDHPHRLCPARCGQCPRDLAQGGRRLPRSLAQARSAPGRG